MTQSLKVRKVHKLTVLLLHKPANQVTFRNGTLSKFIDMLGDPYDMEPENWQRLRELKHVDTTVALSADKAVVLKMEPATNVISMGAADVAKLLEQLQAHRLSLESVNPS